MMTFGTSAFWHGCSGGYYIAFFYGGFVQTAGRLCRAHLRPLFLPANAGKNDTGPATVAKMVYDVIGTIVAVMCTNYAAMPFMLLSVKDSLKGWAAVGWYGHVFVIGAFAFFYGGGGRFCKKLQEKRMKSSATAKAIHDASMTAAAPGRPTANGSQGVATPPFAVPPLDIPLEKIDKDL